MRTIMLFVWFILTILSGLYLGFTIIMGKSLVTDISLYTTILGILTLRGLTSEE